ncbi:Gfo/Idh/MocA family protein [Lentilitoribacter sp. EG35]|jgi:predicted dehydrogenase|uniref:Gfo/Idh/MocA family protein n=1 Tax=Lentilitoribacter sp. EG35 TaxID=3234192 RepID=UPI00345F2CC1
MIDRKPIRVLAVGLGNMGKSHALAYHNDPDFEIVGLVNRSKVDLPEDLHGYTVHHSYEVALAEFKPELVSINTYSDTHADYSIMAMEAGAHVFVEKPIATTVADAKRVADTAKRLKKKLVVGYILRHHPSWITLIEKARDLGGPYVFRLNLNQQSSGPTWQTHKSLMKTTSPIVDCGVHYVDVMCQITDAKPVKVHGMGLRMSDEISPDMYNYGHFQVIFEDKSVGWYEAGWGPMMSETAFFVKDIISPNGSVSIVVPEGTKSDDVDAHTKTSLIRIHSAEIDASGEFKKLDENLSMADEPGHDELCAREQAYMARVIYEDLDTYRHVDDAVQSLSICLAADESIRTGVEIEL